MNYEILNIILQVYDPLWDTTSYEYKQVIAYFEKSDYKVQISEALFVANP